MVPDALAALDAAIAASPGAAAPPGVPLTPELREKLLAALAAAQGDESPECAVCLSPYMLPVITRCAHIYCRR